MWTWALASGWLRAPVTEVAEVGLDLVNLHRWHVLVADMDGGPGTGSARTSAGRAVARVGTHEVPARWHVRRALRDVAHLALTDEDGATLDLDVVFAPWDGGTAVELGASGTRFGGRRLRPAALSRALHRSLADLARAVEHPLEPAPVTRRPRGLAPTDVAPA